MVKSVTGVDLADVMHADTYEAKVNRNVTIEADKPRCVCTLYAS
jgi:flotillin